jgi:hypothetical protein
MLFSSYEDATKRRGQAQCVIIVRRLSMGPFDDPDFEYFSEGTETKARCKHCGAVIDAIHTDIHKHECQKIQ